MSAIKIQGIAEFTRLCLLIGEAAGASVLRPIIKRGADRFAESVKAEAAASRDTGATIESVEAHLVRNQSIAAGYATVDAKRAVQLRNRARQARGRSPVDNDARYPFIVAAGSGPHLIVARNGKALLLGGAARNRAVRAVQHPGFTGTNFFAAGVRAVRSEVKKQLEDEVRQEFLKLAARYNVRAA